MEIWKKIKPGRPTKFESPQALWDAACKYFQWVDNNSWDEIKPMVVDKTVEKVKVPIKLPYTLMECEQFLNVSHSYFRTFKHEAKGTTDEIKLEFLAVIEAIEKTCFNQQYKGAAAGVFNNNIVARALGIKEQTEQTNINFNSATLSKDEIKKISDDLDNEV